MSRISTYIQMQLKTVMDGQAPCTVCLERATGERVGEWPATMGEGLAPEVEAFIQLQAQELPRGQHSYRLVFYDEKRQQLSELPQTVRGQNTDAVIGAGNRLEDQKAVHQMLANYDQSSQHLLTIVDQAFHQLGDERENCNLLLEKLREATATNLDAQMSMLKLQKKFEREDEILAQVVPAVGMLLQCVVEAKGKDWMASLLAKSLPSETATHAPEPTQPEVHSNDQPEAGSDPVVVNAATAEPDGAGPGSHIIRAPRNGKANGAAAKAADRARPKARNTRNGRGGAGRTRSHASH